MYNKIDIMTMANVMACLDHYEKLSYNFTQQVGGKDGQPLRDFWETKIVKRNVSTWMTQEERERWLDIDLHLVNQIWGSTACGWGGLGGAAMTTSHTLIIENHNYGIACVYYGNRLAYICEIDDKFKKYNYDLPGVDQCNLKLTVVFKPSYRPIEFKANK